MSRHELLSPEGLRIDGRRWNELRRFTAKLSTTTSADGSSYVEHGNTKVICAVSGPIEARSSNARNQERATVTVDVCFAAFSGAERKKRGRSDKRVLEMQSSLQRTFTTCMLTALHPRSEVHLSLHVLSQDGSILATCVNAATLALVDAGVPMVDYVVACTAGLHLRQGGVVEGEEGDEILLDVNGAEEGDLPGVTVATVGGGEKIVLLQLETKVAMEKLEGLLAVAVDGCGAVRDVLDGVVRVHGNEMARIGAL